MEMPKLSIFLLLGCCRLIAGQIGTDCRGDVTVCYYIGGSVCMNDTCVCVGALDYDYYSEYSEWICDTDCRSPDVSCLNGGTCLNETCECLPGYTGALCEIDVDECSSSPCHQNATCIDGQGSYNCVCTSGFSGDGFSCQDLDECLTSPCHRNAYCTNTKGSYECECIFGYRGDGFSCTDINECDQLVCSENALCTNTVGSFECVCLLGFLGDGFLCVELDFCDLGVCAENARCTNDQGSFACDCFSGFSGDGFTCTDIDECNQNICSNNTICTNIEGSFLCECLTGYSDIDGLCIDINECVTENPCGNNTNCTNTPGSFQCNCLPGYTGDGITCTDIDECVTQNPCNNNAKCTNAQGSFQCVCEEGFTGDGLTCADINECDQLICSENALCSNTLGSFECSCLPGFLGDGFVCEELDICDLGVCSDNARCNNDQGTFSCDCFSGFSGDGFTCADIDECNFNVCDNNTICTNTEGSFLCECLTGYTEISGTCIDIDECLLNPCSDDGTCINTPGSFQCICVAGFIWNGTICADINECVTENPCRNNSNCTNTPGSFQCNCLSGYSGDGITCTDIDECVTQNPCSNNANCTNTQGSFQCICEEGFTGDGLTCADIDECVTQNPCSNNANCTNTQGSFQCICEAGFTGDGLRCADIDECVTQNPCSNNSRCTNTAGSFQCVCEAGFTGDGFTCEDIDECVENPCGPLATCTNNQGSFQCGCSSGYVSNEFTCVDINECLLGFCSFYADCINTNGSFQCDCRTGFNGNGLVCTDIDECTVELNTCSANADCTNTLGSFRCDCLAGFSGNGFNCTDIDECDQFQNPCSVNANCTNTQGSFQCSCLDGFSGGGFVCSDIDECDQNPCNIDAFCTNNQGSFQCDCLSGFSGDGFRCTDIDECEAQDPCSENANCTNSAGSFQCDCFTGFIGDGFTCTDIDECFTQSLCSINGTCTNTVGSFQCGCLLGFSGDGFLCIDIDECITQNECSTNGTCTNSPGSYVCSCLQGYEGDGRTCTDINECDTDPCDSNANCTNAPGSFQCDCDTGFSGDGFNCTDIDECTILDPCSALANCTNIPGSYSCSCILGFTGDGFTCTVVDCGTTPELENGEITLDIDSETTFGATASVNCVDGYESTMSNISCLATGQWDLNPICLKRDCGTLADPDDGLVNVTDTLYEGIATYTCDTGYVINGTTNTTITRKCLSSGAWSNTDPNCSKIDCGPLSDPSEGMVSIDPDTRFEAVATYTCNPGYQISSTSDATTITITCQSSGSWSDSVPTCSKIDCGTLPTLVNGEISVEPDTKFEATATYTCDTGYIINGTTNVTTTSRTCLSSGWSDNDPACTKRDCGTLADPDDGLVDVTDTRYEGIATYICDTGYVINGTTNTTITRICLSSGAWSYTDPTCSKIDCGPLSDIPDGVVNIDPDTKFEATATYTCNPGYQISGTSDATTTTITCKSSGSWSDSAPTCSKIDCGTLPALVNGGVSVEPDTKFEATATYTCDTGYIINGTTNVTTTSRTCLSSGLWSDNDPTCTKKDCGVSSNPDNGVVTVDPDTKFEGTATYTCNTGYVISGTNNITAINRTCLATGLWSGSIFTCSLRECGAPEIIDNGKVLYTRTTFGSRVTYSCNIGYELQGDSILTCQADGTWSGSPPICNILTCEELQDIPNGQVDTGDGLVYGDVATYTCDDGHTLIGESTRQCGASGTWIGAPPVCQPIVIPITTCPETQDSTYNYVWSVQQIGQTSSKQCPDGFTGTVTRDCREGGLWSETNYNCIREAVIDVQNKASTLNQNSSSEEIADTLGELSNIANITAEVNDTGDVNADLTQGELQVLAETLDTVASAIVSETLTDEISNDFMEVASNLIDEENSDSWRNTESGAERILSAVDQFASTLSTRLQTSNETRNIITKKNIVLEVKKVATNSDYVFPNASEATDYEEDWVQNTTSGLTLSSENLQGNASYITRSSIYRDVRDILPTYTTDERSADDDDTEINGPVIALSVQPPLGRLDPPVTIIFEHTKKGSRNATCNFWSFAENGTGFWSTEGCTVVSSNDTITVCECDHLTNFAVLMSPFKAADAYSLPLRIISIVGICVSILGLVITVFLHLTLWRYLKNDRVTILMNLCIALVLSYIIFIGGVDRTESRESCAAVAAILQYIYLVVFFTMLAEGIEISSSVLFVFSKKSRVKILLILAWVLPGVIVGVSLGVTKADGFGNKDFCWLSMESGLIWAFVGPALAIIFFNCVCLIIVMRAMFTTQAMAQKKKAEKLKTSVRSLCVLMPLMGVTWLIGIFHINDSFYWIQYMFAICNGLQGFFIFLIHCVFNQQLKRAWATRSRRKSSTAFSSSMQNKSSKLKLAGSRLASRESKDLRISSSSQVKSDPIDFSQSNTDNLKDTAKDVNFTRLVRSEDSGGKLQGSTDSSNGHRDSGIGGDSLMIKRYHNRRHGIDSSTGFLGMHM